MRRETTGNDARLKCVGAIVLARVKDEPCRLRRSLTCAARDGASEGVETPGVSLLLWPRLRRVKHRANALL